MKATALLRFFVQRYMSGKQTTRFSYWMARVRVPMVKNWIIRKFLKEYDVQMDDYVESDAFKYDCFNSFFIRAIKLECRPFPKETGAIGSPVDGTVYDFGRIEKDKSFQVKAYRYDVSTLLAEHSHWSRHFESGSYAIIYLAPANYHRIHIPMAGVLEYEHYISGDFFSVDGPTVKREPNVFSRNERLVTIFDTNIGKVAIILVGALLVSGMETVWQKSYQGDEEKEYPDKTGMHLNTGDELGRFNMGSTVVLLFEKNSMKWRDIEDGMAVKMGQIIAQCS